MIPELALENFRTERESTGFSGRWYGVYPGIVTDNQDPDGQGRVKVSLPWSPDTSSGRYDTWARLATLMAGNDRGTWFVPDVNDEVLLAFGGGDPNRPVVIGALWNGSDKPPVKMASGNDIKAIRSRNGVKLTLDDKSGKEQFIVETPGGQKITLKDGPGAVTIEDSNGNSIKLETSGITINASAKVTVTASQVNVSAGMVKVDSGMSTFSGVVKADTVICNSIIASSYTPGAGNIW